MRIWLVTIGEPWPSDAPNIRLLRTGVIAQQYARAGDEVVWFNETFDHGSRRDLKITRKPGEVEPRLRMVALNGRGYRRSVSLSRIGHHRDIARDFRARARDLEKPDVIVASLTPLELSLEAVRYAKIIRVPAIVDIRDLWPDIWAGLAPGFARPLARALLAPHFAMKREIVDGASAICGISEEAVDWALDGRARNAFDGALPLAYQPPPLFESDLAAAEQYWTAKGIGENDAPLTLCFFGTFSRRIEFDTVIEAMRRAPRELRTQIRIVFCGSGEVKEKLAVAAREFDGIHVPGWMNAAQIEVLKRRAHVGLLPYPSDMDFVRSIPNKVFDYLSGGLPILTCLRGVTEQLIAREGCGWLYGNNDSASLTRLLATLAAHRDAVARAADRARAASAQFTAVEVYGSFRERLHAIAEAARI